jgi:hypothetical protein
LPEPEPGLNIWNVVGPWTYRQEYIRCGKPACKRCAPGADGHGPYWYAYRRSRKNGRMEKRYLGKTLYALDPRGERSPY